MDKWKKAISVGMSAALVASLFTAIASTALASTAVVSVGTVPRGGTSTNTATFTFTENSKTAFNTNSATALVVTITDSANGSTVHFTGTPVLTAPDSLGASITLDSSGNFFTIKTTGHDDNNIEQLTVTGLKIKADSGAALGAIKAALTGALAAAVTAATTTATGVLQAALGTGAATVLVNVTSSCGFDNTNANGAANFSDVSDARNVTSGSGTGLQNIGFAAGTSVHGIGTTVTQTVPNCSSALASPGTVADVVDQNVSDVPANVNVGEQNQPAPDTTITEKTPGYIPVGTLTFTLSATGVQFSHNPTITYNATSPALAPTGLAATPSTTGGAIPDGAHCYVVTTLTGTGETTPSTPVCVTTSGGGTSSVVLTWTAAFGATGYNIYQAATAAGPFHLLTGNPVSGSPQTVVGVAEAAGPILPPTTTTATVANGFVASSPCILSFDRTSCTSSVTHVSSAVVTVTLGDIDLDVASTVAAGTAVNVVVTSSPAINVRILANTIAYVSRIVVGTAAQPTIYINYNDQSTGQISLTESAAAFFQSGTGSNNTLQVCITTGETFTRAPFAVVTAGDLKLLDGVVGGTSVKGTLNAGSTCATWTVYTASTVASTIEIRGSDSTGAVLPSGSTNGPRVSVPANLHPGTTQMSVKTGDASTINQTLGLVANAVRAYKSGVVVAAVSQPVIAAGTTDALAGNITITETLNGQFKANEDICVVILPRTSNNAIQDTFLKVATTNDLPVITTNAASGLLVSTVAQRGCSNESDFFFSGFTQTNSFEFHVTQQSFGTLGQITISNIHYTTVADAPNGPVLVTVMSEDANTSGVNGTAFQSNISNARIGSAIAGAAASRLGATQTGAFTTSTKVQKVGKYVTFRFDFGVANAGKHVDIYGATKTGNDWSAFAKVTGRVANASGVVYYYVRQSSATWKSYRAGVTGSGTWTPARQARWIP